jgi:hypothetical protein
MSLLAVAEQGQDNEVTEKAITLFEQSKLISIQNPEDYGFAGKFLLSLKDQEKRIKEWFEPLKRKASEAHKAICEREKESLRPLQEARFMVEPKMLKYKHDQDIKAIEEAARLAELARKEAEDRALMEALAAEQEGDTEAAKAIIEEPIEAPVIRVESAARKITGLTERTYWRYQVNDFKALIQAVAAGKVPPQVLRIDEVFLGGQVRLLKGNLNYPGVKTFSESTMSGARR